MVFSWDILAFPDEFSVFAHKPVSCERYAMVHASPSPLRGVLIQLQPPTHSVWHLSPLTPVLMFPNLWVSYDTGRLQKLRERWGQQEYKWFVYEWEKREMTHTHMCRHSVTLAQHVPGSSIRREHLLRSPPGFLWSTGKSITPAGYIFVFLLACWLGSPKYNHQVNLLVKSGTQDSSIKSYLFHFRNIYPT